MKITFLGTGTSQGVPVIGCECQTCLSVDERDKRLRSSILIEEGNTVISIDAGPDFRQQMLKHSVKRLDAIVVTHAHIDHIGGMDDVRAFNYLSGKAIPVYAEERAGEAIKNVFSYVFAESRYPGVPRIRLIDISDGVAFKIGNIEITPIRVFHHGLPVYGFRMGDFAYITDADTLPDSSFKLLQGVRYLIINALRREKHVSHFNLKEALEVSKNLGCEKTWLTHAGHQMGLSKDINEELSDGVVLAWDGLEIEV